MKRILLLVLSLFIFLSLKSVAQDEIRQIPLTNGGFENWTTGPGYTATAYLGFIPISLPVYSSYPYPIGWNYPTYPVNETVSYSGANVNVNTDLPILKADKVTGSVPQGTYAAKLQSFMLSEIINSTVYSLAQSYIDESLRNSAFPTVLTTGAVDIDALLPLVDDFTGNFDNPVQLLSVFEGRDLNTIINGGVSLNGEIMGKMTGSYKYTSGTGGGDNGGILMLGSKFNPVTHQREVVGAGYKTDMTDISSYTNFEIEYLPLSEIDDTKPYIQADSLVILIFSSANTEPKQGSTLYLDNLQLWSGFPPAEDTCSAVFNLTVTAVDTARANLSWTYEGTPDHFEAEYGVQGFVQGEGTPVTANTNSLLLPNLTPGTHYDVYVRCVCDDDLWGEWAMTTFFTDTLETPSVEDTCGAILNLTVTSLDTTHANLIWTYEGMPDRFEAEYGVQGFVLGEGTPVSRYSNSLPLQDLTPSTRYDVYVRCVCGDDLFGDWARVSFLTLSVPTFGDTLATACGSFSWYGESLTQSGDYPHLFEGGNVTGGDSTVTLHLTINQPTEGDTIAAACDRFTWYDSTYTESGDYLHLIENGNANGCDSTVTLHLTINHGTYNTIDTTVCDSYEWHDSIYTESGTYVFEYSNETDCPSADTLHLTVITIDTYIELHTQVTDDENYVFVTQENAEYQWIDCETNEPIEGETQQQFTPEISGSYACIITLGECADTTECEYVSVGVGISENSTADLILYPNPTTGIVTVQLAPKTLSLNPEIHVFDVYGRMLSVVETFHETSLQTMEIDLSRYANGIYLLKVVDNGKVIAVGKVVKE